MICPMPVRSTERLRVSLRLPNWPGMPWTVLIDPQHGRPDMKPECPWKELEPGKVVHFGLDRVVLYEVEAIAPVHEEPVSTLQLKPAMIVPR